MDSITNTGWVVTKIDKITHTVDINHLKLGIGSFNISLKDPSGVIHTISAAAVASGVTSKNLGAAKGGGTDYKEVLDAERENAAKDLLKYINPGKADYGKKEIYYLDNPMMHNEYLDDKTLTPIPIAKTFTLCSLNVFSFKVKGTLGVALEGSFDIYAFIAGHQFIPSFTSYFFFTVSAELPLIDLYRGIKATYLREKSDSRFEISFAQYYCPFIGLDNSSAWQSGFGWAKDMHEANKKIAKKLRDWLLNDQFDKQPMMSPDVFPYKR
jgi:hypothetical protein